VVRSIGSGIVVFMLLVVLGFLGMGSVSMGGLGFVALGCVRLFGGVHLVAMAMGVVTQTGAQYGFVINCGLF